MRRSGLRAIIRLSLSVSLAIPMVAAPALDGMRPAQAQPVANLPLQGAGDPPARVGRVARLSGTVSFHTADADHWEPATLNYPVTSGNAFWTQPGAAADIDLGGGRARLDQGTEFTVDTLNDQTMAATIGQGHLAMDLRDLPQGEAATLRTPRGVVTFRQAGRYAVQVGDTNRPTIVTVDEGAAEIEAPGLALSLGPHQAAEITGTDNFNGIVVAEAPDSLISSLVPVQRPPLPPAASGPPPEILQMTGYDAIADTGSWQQAPEYGSVWYPPVDPGWVPYRQGRWSWVAPWGWTWVDDAPWGFAPSHYGRWVEINDRWAWTPHEYGGAYIGRPVYAPALVTFLGVAAGVAVGVGVAHAVGWIPLGPREPYYPPYRFSEGYGRRVNGGVPITINNINNNVVTINRFVNNRATTVVPATAMQQSLPVANRVLPAAQVQQVALKPVQRPPIQPNLSTRGMTPAAAQALRLPTGPAAGTPQPAAPGPAFRREPAGRAPGAIQNGAPQPGRAISAAPTPVGATNPGVPAPVTGPARPSANAPVPGAAPGPPIAPRVQGGAAPAPAGAIAPVRPNQGPNQGPTQAPTQGPGPGGAPLSPANRPQPQPQLGGVAPGPGGGAPGPRPNAAQSQPFGAQPPQNVQGQGGAPQQASPPRPNPAPRPPAAPQAAPQPVPQAAPAPRPVAAPIARPAPQPQAFQAPAPRPAPPPQPQAFQPPAPRPAPPPQAQPRPEPPPRAAPPQPRPQPAPPPPPQPRPQPAPPPPPQPRPQPAPPPPPQSRPQPQPQPQHQAPAAHSGPQKSCPPGRQNC